MPAVTTNLNPVEAKVVTDAVLDEMREMSRSLADLLDPDPIEAGEILDARWKIERLGVCLSTLEKFGFIEERDTSIGGYAGTLLAEANAR